MTKKQEIENNMKLLKISKEEAEQLYNDDHSDDVLPEVKEMENKAREMKRRYETSDKPRKSAPRAIKPDENKIRLIQILIASLKDCKELSNITIVNQQKEITFNLKDESYSVTLTKHRKK